MKPTLLFQLSLALTIGWLGPFAAADEPANLILLQDEDKELSRVQTVFYSAEREASIELLVMGAADLGRDNTLVSVISPDGNTERFSSEGQPIVTIENVRQGLHAIVAASSSTHGTKLVNFRPEDERDDAADAPAAEKKPTPTPPARMTLAVTSADVLRPFVDRVRGLSEDGADSEFVDASFTRPDFDYRVVLRSDGMLVGRIFTVFKNPASISVNGTQIGIFQNGSPVAATTCDANGDFSVPNFRPGFYGLIASGPAGYASFAFEAKEGGGSLAAIGSPQQRLVSKIQLEGGVLSELIPVVLIPPSMIPEVIESLEETFAGLRWRTDITGSTPFGTPVGGSMVSPGSAIGGAGGGTVGASAEGGIGAGAGLTGLTGLAGSAALINGSGSGQGVPPPLPASPLIPQTGN